MTSELAVWDDDPHAEEGRKTSSRPVDLVHLSRYTLGERALEREVLELFCSQSSIYIERLAYGPVRQGLEGRRPFAQRFGNGDRRLARRRRGRKRRGAVERGVVRGEGASPPRDRVFGARGGELYRHAARGSLKRPNSAITCPSKALESHCQLPYRARAASGHPFSRLLSSGASLSRCPVPKIGTTIEARQCHGQDHLYSERRDGTRRRGGARHDGDGSRGEEFDPRHRRRMWRRLRLRHLPCLCR